MADLLALCTDDGEALATAQELCRLLAAADPIADLVAAVDLEHRATAAARAPRVRALFERFGENLPPPRRGEVWAFDDAIASLVEELGDPARAAMIRDRSRMASFEGVRVALRSLWSGDRLPWVSHLREAIERNASPKPSKAERVIVGAVPAEVSRLLALTAAGPRKAADHHRESDGVTILGADDGPMHVRVGLPADALAPLMKSIGTVAGHKVIRWLAHQATRDVPEDMMPILTIEDGWEGLARALVLHSAKDRVHLREAVDALSMMRVVGPSGVVSGWLTYMEQRPAPGRPARVEITPGSVWRRGARYLAQRDHHLVGLVPISPPDRLPTLPGRGNEHAAMLGYESLLLRHFTLHSREYVRADGLVIDGRVRRDLADQAGLPTPAERALWEQVIEPFVLTRRADRHRLSGNYAAEDRLIREGGRGRKRRARKPRGAKRR